MDTKHISVFEKEIIDNLQINPTGVYVDLTLGAAGHAMGILERLSGGRLVVFDLELQALKNFADKLHIEYQPNVWLKHGENRVMLINANFVEIQEKLSQHNLEQVDGIIADLGWSKEQLARIPGLSFQDTDADLDMRFSTEQMLTAKQVLGAASKSELSKIFSEYADIYGKQNVALVKQILEYRKQVGIHTVGDLLSIIDSAAASALHRGSSARFSGKKNGIPGTLPSRVFQALRIVVNNELSTLQSMLPHAWNTLTNGGVLEVITFHSGESKIVSDFLHDRMAEATAENIFQSEFLYPSVAELRRNLSARSAKLWGIRRLS